MNYWYYDSQHNCGLGDESIHDHPRTFQSYIVAGGYEHEIYQSATSLSEKIKYNICELMGLQYLTNRYNGITAGMSVDFSTRNFQFAIDKTSKEISFVGSVLLKKTSVETTKQGDIVNIDTNLIHRVSKYHTVESQKTLSLNVVRNSGKFTTNIFLPDKKRASVKTERENVSSEEALQATEELLQLFSSSRN
ncbi:hypothetical protein ELY21_13725 [Legionella sp. km535]|uniref:hypothetical protein n=1 Tax=Legionella sp. km535 TaxID=2498107 RepID=UPI000F8DD23C|nr:hypothetical protein [Legionella sp. km535]RUR16020.1 hypothetical protein ELY21_13725 [Legionella sp. km535]